MNEQILNFLKIFKELQDEYDISFVGYDPQLLEPKFKRLFAMLQFNPVIEVKLLNKMLLMMNPEMPIFEDSQQEKVFFEKQRDFVKDYAVRSQQARKPLKIKHQKKVSVDHTQYLSELPTMQEEVASNSAMGAPQLDIEMAKITSSKTELLAPNNETQADQESDRDGLAETAGYLAYKPASEQERIDALWRSS